MWTIYVIPRILKAVDFVVVVVLAVIVVNVVFVVLLVVTGDIISSCGQ